MRTNPEGFYLFLELADCCKKHYSWAYDECVGNDLIPSGLYYPDWEGVDTCIMDGNEPDYMRANSEGFYLFVELADCCKIHYSWDFDNCVGIDLIPSGLYYPDWEGDNEGCKNDGGEPSYMVNDPTAWMYETLEKCCEERYSWDKDSCLGAGISTPTAGSNNWYVDYYENGSTCVQDCDGAVPCGGRANSWDTLYKSAKVCCEKQLSWIPVATCEAKSSGGTAIAGSNQWYVDWDKKSCVQDCVGGAPCGGQANSWNLLHSSAAKCCDVHLPWVETCGPWSG